jgi:hypothetical protein
VRIATKAGEKSGHMAVIWQPYSRKSRALDKGCAAGIKKPAGAGFFRAKRSRYLILASLYSTCLRTTGSYFLNTILSGVFFLFLSVV